MKSLPLQKPHITFLTFFHDFFAEKNPELNPSQSKTFSQPQVAKPLRVQSNSPSAQSSPILPATQLQPTSSTNFSSCEFLSAITHELKTPLSAIISMSEILEENLAAMSLGNFSALASQNLSAANLKKNSELLAESKSCISDIASITSDMLSLVHDILDVSKVSSGNFSVNLNSEIDLRDVVKRAVKLNYDYSLKRNVAIKVEISDEVKLVKLDAKRMKQIFTNLISNAVKYSPAGSEVKVMIKNISSYQDDVNMWTGLQTQSSARFSTESNTKEIKNNFLEISVADQGFGMTQSQIQTAFQKFQTIENPNSGSVDSFGLGLPITKQLVELQNGTIKMKSEVGKGTIVILEFPFISDVSS
jgi:signal transduction histidine kinase